MLIICNQVCFLNRFNTCHEFGKSLCQIGISSWNNNTIFKKIRYEGMPVLLDNIFLA